MSGQKSDTNEYTTACGSRHNRAGRLCLTAAFLLFCASGLLAQVNPGDAPPPIHDLPKDEKKQLLGQTDPKKRTELTLRMMDTHLKQAEKYVAATAFDEVFRELGSFHYLMDNAVAFLLWNNDDSGKSRGNLKRFEIGLRGFAPRLELIRREMPPDHEYYLTRLTKYLRDARAKTIEPLFGNTQ